ncbi:unnamed protein product [Laminaria digitata]
MMARVHSTPPPCVRFRPLSRLVHVGNVRAGTGIAYRYATNLVRRFASCRGLSRSYYTSVPSEAWVRISLSRRRCEEGGGRIRFWRKSWVYSGGGVHVRGGRRKRSNCFRLFTRRCAD